MRSFFIIILVILVYQTGFSQVKSTSYRDCEIPVCLGYMNCYCNNTGGELRDTNTNTIMEPVLTRPDRMRHDLNYEVVVMFDDLGNGELLGYYKDFTPKYKRPFKALDSIVVDTLYSYSDFELLRCRKGILNGRVVTWYRSGAIHRVSHYTMGIKTDVDTIFTESGYLLEPTDTRISGPDSVTVIFIEVDDNNVITGNGLEMDFATLSQWLAVLKFEVDRLPITYIGVEFAAAPKASMESITGIKTLLKDLNIRSVNYKMKD